MFRSYRTHKHLDWYETDDWLEEAPPAALARINGRLVGLLATSAPLNATCWVRLAALHDNAPSNAVWRAMWDWVAGLLREQGVRTVAMLVLRDWLTPFAVDVGFTQREEIVTLRRAGHFRRDAPPAPAALHLSDAVDLDALSRLDQTAFTPPWQLARAELRQAIRMAASVTIAKLDGETVGYQLSTLYFDGAHLARLAVLPAAQGQGVGAAIVHDLLCRLMRRGIHGVTVNTQASNERSQRLYNRFGFVRNGYDLPVWMQEL